MSKLMGIEQLRAAPSRVRETVAGATSAAAVRRLPVLAYARSAAVRARDVLYPLVVVVRGTVRGTVRAFAWWKATPAERRTAVAFGVVLGGYLIVLLPWGPLLLAIVLAAVVARLGRDPRPGRGEAGADDGRLAAIYNGLVPYLMDEHDPDGLFRPGGAYPEAFAGWEEDADGALKRLELRYSPYFRDGDPQARRDVERALAGKLGRSAEYRYDWDEQANRLAVTVLPPLPLGVVVQPWPVADVEQVVGFTDEGAAPRRIPVEADGVSREMTPVLWRVGAGSDQAHLVIAGTPGSGRSNLLRALAVRAAAGGGRLLLLDGRGDGTFAAPPAPGEAGGVRVETGAPGVCAALAWAVAEVERRRDGLLRARHEGMAPAADLRRRLWVLLDDLPELRDSAETGGLADPLGPLSTLLRQGRLVHVTVAVVVSSARLEEFAPVLLPHAGARVGLGRLDGPACHTLYSTPLTIEGFGPMPPGRGYARMGAGDIVRLQVPVMPDIAAHADTSGLAAVAAPGGPQRPAAAEAPRRTAAVPVTVAAADADTGPIPLPAADGGLTAGRTPDGAARGAWN